LPKIEVDSNQLIFPTLNPAQAKFVYSKKPYLLGSGGYGSGKTTALVCRTILLCVDSEIFGNCAGSCGLLGRNKHLDFKKTTLPELFRWLPRSWIKQYYDKDSKVELINGSEIHFTHLDGVDHLQSFNLAFAAFDQMEQCQREVWDALALERIRRKSFRRYYSDGTMIVPEFDKNTGECVSTEPEKLDAVVKYHTAFGVCNPRHGSFLHELFFENEDYQYSTDPNIFEKYNPEFKYIHIPVMENKHWLPDKYISRQKRNKSAREYARDVEGSWDAWEGKVYLGCSRQTILDRNLIPHPSDDIGIGVDHGGTGEDKTFRTGVTAVTFVSYHKRAGKKAMKYIFDELYLSSSTIKESVKAISDKLKRIQIAQMEFYPTEAQYTDDTRAKVRWWRCDPSMSRKMEGTKYTIIEKYMYEAKLIGMKMPLLPGDNDWVKGIESVDSGFRDGTYRICPKCTHTYSEHASLEYGDNEKIKALQRDHICLHGNTIINTTLGDKKIEDLVGKEGHVYCYNEQEGRITASKFSDVRKTQEGAEVIRVMFSEGNYIVCTPSHPIMLRNGEWVQACELETGDSVMPLYKYINHHGHLTLTLNNGVQASAHRVVYNDCVEKLPKDGWTWNVHHKDSNKLNNSPDNLELVTRAKHASMHSKGKVHGKKQRENMANGITDETRRLRSIRGKGQVKYFKKYREENPEKLDELRNVSIKKFWDDETKDAEVMCHECGSAFMTYKHLVNRVKYCNDKCRQSSVHTNIREKYGMSVRQYYKLKNQGVLNHKVVSVEPYGYSDVYNMFVEDTHNFAANGVIVHNCTALKYIDSAFPRDFSTNMKLTKPVSLVDMQLARMADTKKRVAGGRYGNW